MLPKRTGFDLLDKICHSKISLYSFRGKNGSHLLYKLHPRIFDNGGHGVEFMARYGKIERNVVRNNGFRIPGTSGLFKTLRRIR